METRLEQLLKAEGLTSAKFAEILSVQPSSISHLLSGRNKPNFDFISRLFTMFPDVNPKWFINGDGEMYTSAKGGDLNQGSTPDNHLKDIEHTSVNPANYPQNGTLGDVDNSLRNNEIPYITNVTASVGSVRTEVVETTNVTPLNSQPNPEISLRELDQGGSSFSATSSFESDESIKASNIAQRPSPSQPVNNPTQPTNCTNIPIDNCPMPDFIPQISPNPSPPPIFTQSPEPPIKKKKLVKVLFFYDDDTFDVYDK